MRGSRGGGDRGSGPPPTEICQRWGPVWRFGGGIGGPMPVFISYLSIIASLASMIVRDFKKVSIINSKLKGMSPREDAGGLSREYVLRIPIVS